jgi:predicted RNase H-like HicB family nuclease
MSQIALRVEAEIEADGGWIAEVVDLPGVLGYGATKEEALMSVLQLALFVKSGRVRSETELT